MGIPVLIIGKSGSGKSASLRHFPECGVINVLGKPLPFINAQKTFDTDDYKKVEAALLKSTATSLAIDDAGYLMTNQFMRGHSKQGAGNAIFSFYNDLGDKYWGLIELVIHQLPNNKIVYFMMHEEKNDFGDIKPKSIGKMLDEKVSIEGMFTIALRCVVDNNKHIFLTQSNGFDICKSPINMFPQLEIDNDLKAVDDRIREYYKITDKEAKDNAAN